MLNSLARIPFVVCMRKNFENRKQEVINWIAEGRSKAYICSQLHCKPSTLESRLQSWGITYKGNQGGKGKTAPNKVYALDYLNQEPHKIHTHKANLLLLRDGIKEHKCERCGITEWMGHPVVLELNHIDNNRFNWDFNNIELICPNCHALYHRLNGNGNGRKKQNGQVVERQTQHA